jgi:alpha-L-rhamnosidase
MTSFNHYSLGAVADWMHRTIGGLAPAEPGYHRIEVRPRPGGGITQSTTRHITPYGLAETAWKIEAGKFELDLVVPANTTALVTLPGSVAPIETGSGAWHWSVPYEDPDVRSPYTVDALVGDILGDATARAAILQTFERAKTPGYLRDMILNEGHLSLRQALCMFPDYDVAVKMMSDTLADL